MILNSSSCATLRSVLAFSPYRDEAPCLRQAGGPALISTKILSLKPPLT